MLTSVIKSYFPASGPAGDPFWDDTVLLLGFEGNDGDTTTNDESFANRGASTAFHDGAQIDTAQAAFGGSSLLLDGTDAHVRFSDSTDWNFTATDDFTIEAFIRLNSLSGFQCIVSHWLQTTDQAWQFAWAGNVGQLWFGYSTTGGNIIEVKDVWSPTINNFYHVAVDKSGDTLRIYAEGDMISKATGVPTFHDSGQPLRIGTAGGPAFSQLNDFNGWIDELRITRAARYASDSGYTVPTEPFPRG